MTEKDGGPAFPITLEPGRRNIEGMSLRDWFAGQAIGDIVAESPAAFGDAKKAAQWAYEFADAMLKERTLEADDE